MVMVGKYVKSITRLGELRRKWILFLMLTMAAALFAFVSCAHTVSQDGSTGADGKVKGAKGVSLENGEGRVVGIVTYPGGDRVDWKMVETPDGKVGNLELKLSWTPPRPGLQLGMEVFDAWNFRVGNIKGRPGSSSRTKRLLLQNVKGKYFVRIFAVNRGDAGKYKFSVAFSEAESAIAFDMSKVQIPDPPRLIAIPVAVEACNDDNFDPKKKECKKYCPTVGAPPAWPPCGDKCPTPPSIDNPLCWPTMQCPNPAAPDPRVKSCLQFFKPCDPNNIDPNNPKCTNFKAPPVYADIIDVKVDGDSVAITMNRGNDKKIDQNWKGQILRKGTDKPIDGGDFVVISVGKRESKAKVRLSVDVVKDNLRVRFLPP
jgi:hypothetical protein